MTSKTKSKSFQKYAKAIGVDITENNQSLLEIAYNGFTDELEPNYCYKIVNNNTIAYQNIKTKSVYDIHPNYKTYRKIVSDYKNEQLNEISGASEASHNTNNPILESEIDEIEKNFKKLDLDYQTEVELLEDHVKNVCGKFLNHENLMKLSELTQKFEEIDKCKRECKSLYKICQVEIEKLCDQMMKLERLDNKNTLEDDDKYQLTHSNHHKIGSDSEDEDDINLKIKCFNEQELDEFHEEILDSYLSLKSIRK